MAKSCRTDRCFYCDGLLSRRHEHDHFPVPKRHGGTNVVCACINCHDLKDRQPLAHWSPSAFPELLGALWVKLTPAQRIYLAKVHALALDAIQVLRNAGQA